LEVSRSAYYAWTTRKPSDRNIKDKAITRELVKLHTKHPTLGLDSLHQMLKSAFGCSRKRVHRLKRAVGIRSTRHKAYRVTTNSNHKNPVSPNLLGRKFRAARPNQAWVSDITYIPTGQGWLYCAIIKDLFTKKIVGYATSNRINTQLCLDALNMAVFRQRPNPGLIIHSDRGVQYTSIAFRNTLFNHGFNQSVPARRPGKREAFDFPQSGNVLSMSRKGDPYDNAVAENFFSCLKCECVHLNHFATKDAAKLAIFSYIETFYNRIRPHSGIGWLSPCAFERLLTSDFEGGSIAV